MSFADKITVVTGGSSGIGRAAAIGFAEAKATVINLDINKKEGEKLAAEYPDMTYLHCDLRSVEAIKAVFADIPKKLGEIDILVNSAGLANRTLIPEVTEQEWDLLSDVNLKATFFCSQQAVMSMLRGGKGGRIVNVSSVRAYFSDHRHTIYDATKAGVQAISRSFAVAYAKDGITANTVSPAYTLSSMTAHNLERRDWMAWLTSRIPLGRMMDLSDTVGAIMFFASPETVAVTGQNLYIDGGWTAHE